MSTMPGHPSGRSPRWATALASFWVVDVLVVALLAFFIVVGAGTSPVIIVIAAVLALLYVGHVVQRRRHAGEATLSREAQHDRERRGF